MSQRFCLRWNNHQSNLLSVFDQLLHDESFVDVTLAVEGQLLRAHKMVLSACSPYFQALFVSHPDKHPIVILKDVPFVDMRSLLDFMYRGEVSVDQDRLTAFLKVAESLRIKGLTEVNEENCDLPTIANNLLSSMQQTCNSAPPPPNLHRIQLAQPAKRPNTPNSLLLAQKRKRGRPRKLSGSSDTPSVTSGDQDVSTLDADLRHSNQSNMSDSSYAHGPPDLLEVNMSDHGQASSPSVSEENPIGSPEQDMSQDNNEDFCYGNSIQIIKKEDRPSPPSTSREKCHWKEILNRLKKPDLSIQLETDVCDNNGTYIGQSNENMVVGMEEEGSSISIGLQSQENMYNIYDKNGNSKKNEIPYSEIRRVFYPELDKEGPDDTIDLDGDDEEEEDDDDTMSKFEYDSFKSIVQDQFEGGGSGYNQSALMPSETIKPMDKSSVRQFCVQVAEHLFQCTVCCKTYTHISNFSRHFLSAHHGLRQEVPCPVCLRIFTRRDNMLTHMKQVHRIAITRGSASSFIKKLTEQNAGNSPSSENQTSSSSV